MKRLLAITASAFLLMGVATPASAQTQVDKAAEKGSQGGEKKADKTKVGKVQQPPAEKKVGNKADAKKQDKKSGNRVKE